MKSRDRKRYLQRWYWINTANPFFDNETRLWLNIEPVGREFGSPEYEKITIEEAEKLKSSMI